MRKIPLRFAKSAGRERSKWAFLESAWTKRVEKEGSMAPAKTEPRRAMPIFAKPIRSRSLEVAEMNLHRFWIEMKTLNFDFVVRKRHFFCGDEAFEKLFLFEKEFVIVGKPESAELIVGKAATLGMLIAKMHRQPGTCLLEMIGMKAFGSVG